MVTFSLSAHQRHFAPHVRASALGSGLDLSQRPAGETPIPVFLIFMLKTDISKRVTSTMSVRLFY